MLVKTLLSTGAGTGGAYAMSGDPYANKYMMKLVEGTGLDPATLQYAQDGMSPLWAFVTIATVGIGPHLGKAASQWIIDRSADRSRREAQDRGDAYVE